MTLLVRFSNLRNRRQRFAGTNGHGGNKICPIGGLFTALFERDRGGMNFKAKTKLQYALLAGCLATIGVSLAYLAFLCALDYYFVVHANEVRGWYNNAALMVFTLPIVLAGVGFRLLPRPENLVFAFLSIPVGLFICYLELTWVATRFHTMIGGSL